MMRRILYVLLTLTLAVAIFPSCSKGEIQNTQEQTADNGSNVQPQDPEKPENPQDPQQPDQPQDPDDPSGFFTIHFGACSTQDISPLQATIQAYVEVPDVSFNNGARWHGFEPFLLLAADNGSGQAPAISSFEKLTTAYKQNWNQREMPVEKGMGRLASMELKADIEGLTPDTEYWWMAGCDWEYTHEEGVPEAMQEMPQSGTHYSQMQHFRTALANITPHTDNNAVSESLTQLRFSGYLTVEDGATWTEAGIQVSSDADFREETSRKTAAGSVEVGSVFYVQVNGLEPNTTYYYRAYATYPNGTDVFGETKEAKTAGVDDMLRFSLGEIGAHTAPFQVGLIHYVGAEFGFRWGESEEQLSHTVLSTDMTPAGSAEQVATFRFTLDGLNSNTRYYYQGYLKLDGKEYAAESVRFFDTPFVHIQSISLEPSTKICTNLHESFTLTPVFTPDDATDKRVSWSSSDLSVATVDENGQVNIVGRGPASATITVKTQDGAKKASCPITVTSNVNSLELLTRGASDWDWVAAPARALSWDGEEIWLRTKAMPEDAGNTVLNWVATPADKVQIRYLTGTDGKPYGIAVRGVEYSGDGGYAVGHTATLTGTTTDGTNLSVSIVIDFEGAVDLGPGTSVKWSTMNIGATSRKDIGDYYNWGVTEPVSDYDIHLFNFNYKWLYLVDPNRYFTKYVTNSQYGYEGFTDGKTTLESEDDVARVKLGSNWRIPTPAEFEELLTTCNLSKETADDGQAYWLFTSKSNGRQIIFPCEVYGCWSSELLERNNAAKSFEFNGSSAKMDSSERAYSLNVRPVKLR